METCTIEALGNSSQDEETLREDQDLEVQHSKILMRTSPRTKTTPQIYHRLAQSKILLDQKTLHRISNKKFEKMVSFILQIQKFSIKRQVNTAVNREKTRCELPPAYSTSKFGRIVFQ